MPSTFVGFAPGRCEIRGFGGGPGRSVDARRKRTLECPDVRRDHGRGRRHPPVAPVAPGSAQAVPAPDRRAHPPAADGGPAGRPPELDGLSLSDIAVVTDRRYGALVREQLGPVRIITEPVGRNTAA